MLWNFVVLSVLHHVSYIFLMKHVDNNAVSFTYTSFKNTLTFSTINIMVRSLTVNIN